MISYTQGKPNRMIFVLKIYISFNLHHSNASGIFLSESVRTRKGWYSLGHEYNETTCTAYHIFCAFYLVLPNENTLCVGQHLDSLWDGCR